MMMMPQSGEARRGEARRGKARMMQGCTFLQLQPPLATCYECDSCSLECNAKRVAKKGNTHRERERKEQRGRATQEQVSSSRRRWQQQEEAAAATAGWFIQLLTGGHSLFVHLSHCPLSARPGSMLAAHSLLNYKLCSCAATTQPRYNMNCSFEDLQQMTKRYD